MNGREIFMVTYSGSCSFPGVLCSEITQLSNRIHRQDAAEGTSEHICIIHTNYVEM